MLGVMTTKIETIVLRNYRQFREADIDLRTPPGKDIIIIQGGMGVGKTNVLNAIDWCLYGRESHLRDPDEALPIINTLALSEMEEGDFGEVSVELKMRDSSGKRVIVQRTLAYLKTGDELGEERESDLRVFRQSDGSMKSVTDPKHEIAKLVPVTISEYFFFDGDRLDDYFSEESGQQIKQAVYDISQLELLQRAEDHLETLRNEYRRKVTAASPKTQRLEGDLQVSEKTLKAYGKKLESLEAEKFKAKTRERELRSKLRRYSESSELATMAEEAEARLDEARTDEKEVTVKLEDILVDYSPFVVAYDAMSEMHSQISARDEAGDIPPDYKRSFLEGLLARGKCICETDISEKKSGQRKIIEYLVVETSDISELSGELIVEHSNLRRTLEKALAFRSETQKVVREREKVRKRIEESSRELRTMRERLGSVDVEEVRNWEGELEALLEALDQTNESIGEFEEKSRVEGNKKEQLERRLKREISKEKSQARDRRRLAFCEEALATATLVKETIMEETRRKIEERTWDFFSKSLVKDGAFTSLKISKGYKLSVRDQKGRPALGSVSMGETETLALGFISAVNSVSGFQVPIVIDMPLARIAPRPRLRISRALPTAFEGRQVLLLVTEAEYTPAVRRELFPAVGKELEIQFFARAAGNEARVVEK